MLRIAPPEEALSVGQVLPVVPARVTGQRYQPMADVVVVVETRLHASHGLVSGTARGPGLHALADLGLCLNALSTLDDRSRRSALTAIADAEVPPGEHTCSSLNDGRGRRTWPTRSHRRLPRPIG